MADCQFLLSGRISTFDIVLIKLFVIYIIYFKKVKVEGIRFKLAPYIDWHYQTKSTTCNSVTTRFCNSEKNQFDFRRDDQVDLRVFQSRIWQLNDEIWCVTLTRVLFTRYSTLLTLDRNV